MPNSSSGTHTHTFKHPMEQPSPAILVVVFFLDYFDKQTKGKYVGLWLYIFLYILYYCNIYLPDVWLCATVPSQLILCEVSVVGGGNEVVCQWECHVLVNPSMFRVKYTVLLRQHVHGETIWGHEMVFLGCMVEKKAQTLVKEGNC